jgi:hypothetical protein
MAAYVPHYSFATYLDSYAYYYSQFTPGTQAALRPGYNDPTVTVDTSRLLERRGVKTSTTDYDYVLDYANDRFRLLFPNPR